MMQIRLWAYLLVALALSASVFYIRHLQVKAARVEAAETALATERENTRIANESANRYAARLAVARGPRSPPAQLMCKLPSVPPAARRTDAPAAPDNDRVPAEVDIGPRLDVSYGACEENLIKLEELQRFIRESR